MWTNFIHMTNDATAVLNCQQIGQLILNRLVFATYNVLIVNFMCQVPVVEGKEPPCFIRLFKGHMIIHAGKRDEPVVQRWRLYMSRNELPLEAYLWEIPAECRNLRSRASFILADCEKSVLYLSLIHI